jgi:hypothetical protein
MKWGKEKDKKSTITGGQPSQECGGNTYCFARRAESLLGTGYQCAIYWPLVACEAWPVGAFMFRIWPMGCTLPTSALILVLDHTSS